MPSAIPDDLLALLPKLRHLADYVAFESDNKKLWCYLSWTGDAPGDDPRDTTQDAYREAKEIVEAVGYETEYNHIDHDSAIFDILPKKGNAMAIQVNVEPGEIEKMVADSILNSALGETLKEEVQKAVKSLSDWDSPLKKAIAAHIQNLVMVVLAQEYDEKMKEAVRAHLTDEVVNGITHEAWNAFMGKLDKVERGRY